MNVASARVARTKARTTSGREPHPTTTKAIADALDIDASELLGEPEPSPRSDDDDTPFALVNQALDGLDQLVGVMIGAVDDQTWVPGESDVQRVRKVARTIRSDLTLASELLADEEAEHGEDASPDSAGRIFAQVAKNIRAGESSPRIDALGWLWAESQGLIDIGGAAWLRRCRDGAVSPAALAVLRKLDVYVGDDDSSRAAE